METILESCESCKATDTQQQKTLEIACPKCSLFCSILKTYANANIPVKYWRIKFDDSFKSDTILKKKFEELTLNGKISQTYKDGICLYFSGSNGVGKTFTVCNILKKALEKGYGGYYCTLLDIVNRLVYDNENKIDFRQFLISVDFLVIDEFDPRHMGTTTQAASLFGRILEDVFRTRVQNKMPTFMCTNSLKLDKAFPEDIQRAISSLMNYMKEVPVLGKDLRKEGK
jgi:DNA replication protein DnaC